MVQEIATHRIVEGSDNDNILIHHHPQAPNEINSYKDGDKYFLWVKNNNNWDKKIQINFGKMTPSGMDGVTVETLLAVILDRFQQQKLFPVIEEHEAKHRIVQALEVLKGKQSVQYVPPPPPKDETIPEAKAVKKTTRKKGVK